MTCSAQFAGTQNIFQERPVAQLWKGPETNLQLIRYSLVQLSLPVNPPNSEHPKPSNFPTFQTIQTPQLLHHLIPSLPPTHQSTPPSTSSWLKDRK